MVKPELPDTFSLATLQWDIRLNDVSGNLEIFDRLTRKAVAAGARFLLLPEMWSAGFCEAKLKLEAAQLQDRLAYCRDCAREHQIWIAAGTLPEPAPNGKVFNTLFLIDPEGKVRYQYRKMHLFPNTGEPLHFASPTEFPESNAVPLPFTSGNWHVSAAICFEIRFPEIFRQCMKQRANLFLVPAQFPDPRLEHFRLLSRARALENQSYLVAVNRTGGGDNLVFSGGSAVFGPFGELLSESGKGEGFSLAAVDFHHLQSIRRQYPFIDHTPVLDRMLNP